MNNNPVEVQNRERTESGDLLESRLGADNILSSASTPIIIRDNSYKAIWMNPPAIEVFGGLDSPKFDPRVVADFGEYELHYKESGKYFRVRRNTLNNGTGIYLIETYHDITEEAKEREEVKIREYPLKDGRKIMYCSRQMHEVFLRTSIAATSNSSILIQGETGTGKDLIARLIHEKSDRNGEYKKRDKNGEYVVCNCSELEGHRLVSELFGHLKGSYTGAHRDKKGLFEAADRGTLFLDEIGDMNLDVQAKVLRAIESGEFRKLGATRGMTADVRVIAATNKDLEEEVRKGNFRQDLFYRLHVFSIYMPPLRERRADIPVLVGHFLSRLFEKDSKRDSKRFSKIAMEQLMAYSWPGNVRELKSVVASAAILSNSKPVITEEELHSELRYPELKYYRVQLGGHQSLVDVGGKHMQEALAACNGNITGPITLREMEQYYAQKVLEECDGNRTKAAKCLGISRITLRRKLRKIGR